MIKRLSGRTLLVLLSLCLALPLRSAEPAERSESADQPLQSSPSLLSTNGWHPIAPGPIDGQIAAVTAALLKEHHYLKKPFDEALSGQFLDRYLETLDPQHLHFTQADLAEFEQYRTNLNRLTSTGRRQADTTPACEIFNRFMERLVQRTSCSQRQLLKR